MENITIEQKTSISFEEIIGKSDKELQRLQEILRKKRREILTKFQKHINIENFDKTPKNQNIEFYDEEYKKLQAFLETKRRILVFLYKSQYNTY